MSRSIQKMLPSSSSLLLLLLQSSWSWSRWLCHHPHAWLFVLASPCATQGEMPMPLPPVLHPSSGAVSFPLAFVSVSVSVSVSASALSMMY
ncbi:MAG: hypothetical protein J3Q66DRAFT_345912 [Benniella sp.]|nr:MAG: hypothetical protein J3Q66DRAFT_345912 [Benniella sp.]